VTKKIKPFWDHWPSISKWISSGKRLLLFLDFDGTLSPIVKTPNQASIDASIKDSLKKLSRIPFYEIFIISGRSLKDVRKRVGLKNIHYAGNHGIDLSGTGLPIPSEVRQLYQRMGFIRLLSQKMETAFKPFPGVFIEDKGPTLSLHYRNLPKEHEGSFRALVYYFAEQARRHSLVWRRGKKVWEVKLASPSWGKAEAMLYIQRNFRGSLLIAIGDDVTDEDMFRAIPSNGISVRVGKSKRSAADYYFKSIDEVDLFLRRLCF